MKKYKKRNGYYKHFSIDCNEACRIKIEECIIDTQILIKFKKEKDNIWKYYSPKQHFKNANEVIWFICKNLENPDMVFKVMPINKIKEIS